jgi:predicted HTH domain antitoxin
MAVTIELPPNVESRLRAELANLDDVAKLGLAVEAFRNGKLSVGQFAELLGVSQYAADGILKERGILFSDNEDELTAEREALERLIGS